MNFWLQLNYNIQNTKYSCSIDQVSYLQGKTQTLSSSGTHGTHGYFQILSQFAWTDYSFSLLQSQSVKSVYNSYQSKFFRESDILRILYMLISLSPNFRQGSSIVPWMWGIILGGIQHSPVNGCLVVSCNFQVLAGEVKCTSFYSTILFLQIWGKV